MSRLTNLLPFNDGETVASYCSRLSAACGYRHARSFGYDLGFRFQGLANGDMEELQKFASVLERPSSFLTKGLVVGENRMISIAGQSLTRALVQRQRLRYCPLCIREDENLSGGRRGFRAYGRIDWLLTPIRACRIHGVQLATSEIITKPVFIHDFAANLREEMENNETYGSSCVSAQIDSLQEYVEAKLCGTHGNAPWLDTFPLYVAVRLCETVGATERLGRRFKNNQIDELEWSRCAGTGFDILSSGEESFRGHLHHLLKHFYKSNGDIGGRAVFGRLYEMLAHETSDTAYDPIRSIMRDVALNSLPLGPGDDFFGPVTERKLHSVQSASKHFDIHPKRLRKLLVNSNLIKAEDKTKTFERILLKAETMERFVWEAKTSLDVPEAKAYLGASRMQFETLVKSGILKPHARLDVEGDKLAPVNRRFTLHDMDELHLRLRAAVTTGADEGMSTLEEAVQKAGCKLTEILEQLLAKRLTKVGWVKDQVGLAAIRLDVDEIKEATIGDQHGCLSFREVTRLIPASSKIVKALAEAGHLPIVQRRNPVKRNLQNVVEPVALENFIDEFVSLGNLATSRRTRTWSLERKLDTAGIRPVFRAAEMPFYRRSETAKA